MIDRNIVNYASQQLRAGYNINAIRTALLQQGYSQANVNDSINYIFKGGKMAKAKSMNVEYGGFWIRLSAAVWDSLIFGIPLWILNLLLIFATGMQSSVYIVSLAFIALTVYFEGAKGGTPGKLIIGLRIRNEKGGFIGIPMAILRYLGKILSGIILGIGYLMIAFTEKKQGLHDKIAGSFVIKENVRKGWYVAGLVIGVLLVVGAIAMLFAGLFLMRSMFGAGGKLGLMV